MNKPELTLEDTRPAVWYYKGEPRYVTPLENPKETILQILRKIGIMATSLLVIGGLSYYAVQIIK